jgi:hypothetical protein
MPLQFRVIFVDGQDTLFTLWNDRLRQDYQLTFSKRIQSLQFDPDNWILKQVSDEDINDQIPTEIILHQNYPNPFNNVTTIEFSLHAPSRVTLDIYDLLGQHIHNIVTGDLTAGDHQYSWNTKQQASGVYLYRLVAKPSLPGEAIGYVETRKMVLMR